jgi:DNA-binding GntR family transcriptional regulator
MTDSRPQTKSEEIFQAILRQIDDGTYPVGTMIPSTADLQEEFETSKSPVTAAVAELKAKGVLEGKPGKGVYVVATSERLSRDQADLTELTTRLRQVQEEIDELKSRPASEERLQQEVELLRNMVINLYGYVMELYSRIGARQPEGLKDLSQDFRSTERRDAS